MLTVIAGMSASGKSAYAEKRALELADGGALYYVATMEPYGEEGQRRIERHRRLRAGKGFQTIECCRHIEKAADGIDAAERGEATVLVECLSNLLANEMFPPAEAEGAAALLQAGEAYDAAQRVQRDAGGLRRGTEEWERDVCDRILSGLAALRGQCRHLIIVTDEVCADGIVYEKETEVYIKLLGALNRQLTAMADEAIEVVYTVPLSVSAR